MLFRTLLSSVFAFTLAFRVLLSDPSDQQINGKMLFINGKSTDYCKTLYLDKIKKIISALQTKDFDTIFSMNSRDVSMVKSIKSDPPAFLVGKRLQTYTDSQRDAFIRFNPGTSYFDIFGDIGWITSHKANIDLKETDLNQDGTINVYATFDFPDIEDCPELNGHKAKQAVALFVFGSDRAGLLNNTSLVRDADVFW